jgi:hypothetical protein
MTASLMLIAATIPQAEATWRYTTGLTAQLADFL